MNQQPRFQFSFLVGLICDVNACVDLPAVALPGQSAEEVNNLVQMFALKGLVLNPYGMSEGRGIYYYFHT